jgi:hypothetical protein
MNSMVNAASANCVLCDLPSRMCHRAGDGSFTIQVQCDRCGRFTISEEALSELKPSNKYLLSAACRLWVGDHPPRILTATIGQLIDRVPRFTPGEQLDALLQLIAKQNPELGSMFRFRTDIDYPLIVARNTNEAAYIVDGLVHRGFLSNAGRDSVVTLDGWERLAAIRQSGRQSAFAFVAMWFDSSTNQLFDNAIRPAIRAAGYESIRIDRHEHVNRIDDEIVGQIKRSRFMVADFTGQRHGVYFEAGLMMGLGRNVIWMCDQRELHANNIHFDVRQYNFIDWTSPEDARTRLFNRILAIESNGPRPSDDGTASS